MKFSEKLWGTGWPSQRAITAQSTPEWSSAMAAAWRRTCGVTRLSLSDGHTLVASAAYFCTIRSTASRLRRPPRMLVNRASRSLPGRSANQERRASTLSFRSGVARSFRPLPMHRTCAPVPRTMSPQDRLISSETLRPVCSATTSRVLSRRPNHVLVSGAATSAAISARLR